MIGSPSSSDSPRFVLVRRTPRQRTKCEVHASFVISTPVVSNHVMSLIVAPRIGRPCRNIRGAATDIDAQRVPGKRRLQDTLAQIAGEEDRGRAISAQRSEEAKCGDTDVLRFIDDGELVGRSGQGLQLAASRENIPALLMRPLAAISGTSLRRCADGRLFTPCFPMAE
jgi:hypothetical protein